MSKESRNFLYVESPQIPLKEVPFGDLMANITDPTTGKPYKGIVLEGVFAQFSDIPNNNKRIYDIPEYLKLLDKFKQQVLSSKGVYGELEHPEKYSVNLNNISHKIIDVWYVPETLTVMGRVLLLDTPNGKIAQEVIKSGGRLAISARAAGEEIKQNDGTFKAVTKLLTTYDLVYHPGFSEAVLEFKKLNESQQFLQKAGSEKQGYCYKIYKNNLDKISNAYNTYITLNESVLERRSKCFQEWFMNLNESSQEQNQQQIIEQNESPDEKQKQQKLEKAVQKELKQQALINRKKNAQKAFYLNQVKKQNNKLKTLDRTVFDNSAGFVTEGISTTGI